MKLSTMDVLGRLLTGTMLVAAVAPCVVVRAGEKALDPAAVPASVGADRLTNVAAIPVVDLRARNGYVGSIDPSGRNDDWDWGEVQDENGEWILFEDEGAGCVYNFTQHRRESAEVPLFRFYFDGEKTPRLEARPKDFGYTDKLPKPLGGAFEIKVNGGKDFRIVRSFVPMEYCRGCRITSTVKLSGNSHAGGGWGHVMCHHYGSAEGLATFNPGKDLTSLAAQIDAGLGLAADDARKTDLPELKPGAEVELFAASARGTLAETALEIPDFALPMATNLWLVYEFDGVRTVEAPIGTFFGCETPGSKARLQTTLITFERNAAGVKLSNRFPMPYFRSCRVLFRNCGGVSVRASARIGVNSTLVYDPVKTGVFTAAPYYPKTRNTSGKNAKIGRLVGRGFMAYGTISGYDFTSKPGWGACEGDVRCFIDDMTVPRVQSDGSESWGSWGWGFCRGGSVNPFSFYDVLPGGQMAGWSQLRLTYADAYNFRRFLRFDLEHGQANDHPESASSGQIFGYLLRGK